MQSLTETLLNITYITHLPFISLVMQLLLQLHTMVHLYPFLMHPQHPFMQSLFAHVHVDFRHGLTASVMTWCTSWMVHLLALLSLYSPESINCHMISNSGAMMATSLAGYWKTYLLDGIHQFAFFDPVDNSPGTVAIHAPPELAISKITPTIPIAWLTAW